MVLNLCIDVLNGILIGIDQASILKRVCYSKLVFCLMNYAFTKSFPKMRSSASSKERPILVVILILCLYISSSYLVSK